MQYPNALFFKKLAVRRFYIYLLDRFLVSYAILD
jgi:hypothetical protein